MSEVQYREVQVRAFDADSRTVSGLAVPYGETIDVEGYRERFERGNHVFRPDATLYAIHEHRNGGLPIGKVTEWEDTDDGVVVRARISETDRGNEVYTLLRDGVISGFSVGFIPKEHRMDGDVVVRTATEFFEVSVTPHGAYQSARISEVRERTENKEAREMPESNEIDVQELRDSITDLERRLQVMSETRDSGLTVPKFRSGGELLKALARGDEDARNEFRNFQYRAADQNAPATATQALAAKAGQGWLSWEIRQAVERRRMINLFSNAPLPDLGNSVEFPKVGSTSGTLTSQAAEGDALDYLELELTTGTASVVTYGAYSRLSRQAIERSDVGYLEAVLKFQAIQYATATEAAVRTAVDGAATGSAVNLGSPTAHASATTANWVAMVVDACAQIESDSAGLQADFIIVSSDVFKSIATKTDQAAGAGRTVFSLVNDGQNSIGWVNATRPQFNIAGLPGFVDPNLAANTGYVASRDAVTVLESPGAPFRLQDEAVTTLTKDFSLYGYMAVTVNDGAAVVDLNLDGA